MTLPAASSTATTVPTACPFCRSTQIAVPNDKVSDSTYWRCMSCAQMWNISRQITVRPPRWNR